MNAMIMNELAEPVREAVVSLRGIRPPHMGAEALARISGIISPSGNPTMRWVNTAAALAACTAVVFCWLVWLGSRPQGITAVKTTPNPAPIVMPSADSVSPSPQFGVELGTSPTRRLAISPAATILVATGDDQPIKLGSTHPYSQSMRLHVWDWSKSELSRPLAVSWDRAFTISPDGSRLVTSDARIVDLGTGKEIGKVPNLAGDVPYLAFSPDGKRLLFIERGVADKAWAFVLSYPDGKVLCQVQDVWNYTFTACFTADSSQFLVMGSDRVIRRYAAATGKELGKADTAHVNSIRAIAVSPDGKYFASAGTRGNNYLFELATGKLVRRLVAIQKPDMEDLRSCYSMAFSPDSSLLAGGGIGNLVLWQVDGGEKPIHIYPRASGGAVGLRFSGDGQTITTVSDFVGVGFRGNDLAYPRVQEFNVERN